MGLVPDTGNLQKGVVVSHSTSAESMIIGRQNTPRISQTHIDMVQNSSSLRNVNQPTQDNSLALTNGRINHMYPSINDSSTGYQSDQNELDPAVIYSLKEVFASKLEIFSNLSLTYTASSSDLYENQINATSLPYPDCLEKKNIEELDAMYDSIVQSMLVDYKYSSVAQLQNFRNVRRRRLPGPRACLHLNEDNLVETTDEALVNLGKVHFNLQQDDSVPIEPHWDSSSSSGVAIGPMGGAAAGTNADGSRNVGVDSMTDSRSPSPLNSRSRSRQAPPLPHVRRLLLPVSQPPDSPLQFTETEMEDQNRVWPLSTTTITPGGPSQPTSSHDPRPSSSSAPQSQNDVDWAYETATEILGSNFLAEIPKDQSENMAHLRWAYRTVVSSISPEERAAIFRKRKQSDVEIECENLYRKHFREL